MKNVFHYAGGYVTKWLIIATLVGIGGGLSAVVLKKAISFVEGMGSFLPLWLAPIIGGVLVSIIYIWDELAAGFGTNHYICAGNKIPGHLSFRTVFSKLTATAVTLGLKGSGGVEGPMLVIGGSLADGISKIPFFKGKFTEDDYRMLTICGAAGAIGAIFKSPLGGGIFVVEVLYRTSLHYTDLFPSMLSSTMGFVIYSMISEGTPMFNIPDYMPNVFNVPLFVLTGIIAGIGSLIFMFVFEYAQKFFQNLPYKKLHPILGGLLTGLILIVVPQAAGTGTNIIQEMIDNNIATNLLFLLFLGKILATSFTVASGGSAGLVIPALFIGAISGNLLLALIPNAEVGLSASLVISGMAASLASIANVPISAAIMLVEMVGLRLGVPATLGSVIGYALGRSHIIYGNTCPTHNEFEEIKEWRQNDQNKEEH